MPLSKATGPASGQLATMEDVRHLAGDVENGKALEILKLKPTVDELEQAVMWAAGNGDIPARQGHPLAGTAAAIFDILSADEEEPPPVR